MTGVINTMVLCVDSQRKGHLLRRIPTRKFRRKPIGELTANDCLLGPSFDRLFGGRAPIGTSPLGISVAS